MIKKIFKKIIPEKFLKLRRDFLSKRKEKRYSSMQLEDVFKEIYNKKLWTPENEKKNNRFYSGIGSRHEEFTEVYIDKATIIRQPNKIMFYIGFFCLTCRKTYSMAFLADFCGCQCVSTQTKGLNLATNS